MDTPLWMDLGSKLVGRLVITESHYGTVAKKTLRKLFMFSCVEAGDAAASPRKKFIRFGEVWSNLGKIEAKFGHKWWDLDKIKSCIPKHIRSLTAIVLLLQVLTKINVFLDEKVFNLRSGAPKPWLSLWQFSKRIHGKSGPALGHSLTQRFFIKWHFKQQKSFWESVQKLFRLSCHNRQSA